MKSKLSPDPETLTALIAIYSFNDASASLLSTLLKIEPARITNILNMLAQVGILGGTDANNRKILVRKNEAKRIMMEHGVYYDEVKFFEGIYRYQKQVRQQAPDAIKPVETVIKEVKDPMATSNEKEKNSKYRKKLSGIIKKLLIINAILGIFVLLLETNHKEMSSFKRFLFSVSVAIINKPNGVQVFSTPDRKTPPTNTLTGYNKLIVLDKNGPAETINGVAGNWMKIKYYYVEGWIWSGDISELH